MKKTLNVDWKRLKEMSTKALNTSKEFEQSRSRFQQIINSLDDCWGGIDSKCFVRNCDSYLNSLKNDTIYLENLGKYFDHSSNAYSGIVNEYEKKVIKINEELETEQADIENMVGD